MREASANFIFQSFGSKASEADFLMATLGALTGSRRHQIAGMAHRLTAMLVECQRYVTVRAFFDMATLRANERGSEASSIEKEDDLAAGIKA